MILPFYILQFSGVFAVSYSSLEDSGTSENSDYPVLHNDIYKKKETVPVENDAFQTPSESTQSKPDKKPSSFYPLPLLNKLRHTPDPYFSNNDPANPNELKNDNTDQIYKFCWRMRRQALFACIDIFKNRNLILANKCAGAKSLEELVNCQNNSIYAYAKNYSIEQDDDQMIEKRNQIPKRLPFHSWGGKRANQVGTEKIQASRVPFNAWGGKRNNALAPDEDETKWSICCTKDTYNV